MVHRLILIGAFFSVSCALSAETIGQSLAEDHVRQNSSLDIMGYADQARTSQESSLASALLLDKAKPTKRQYPIESLVPDIRAFTGVTLRFKDALTLISRSIGYGNPVIQPSINGNKKVSLSKEFSGVDTCLADLQEQTGTIISLFPSGRTLIVTKRRSTAQ